MQRAITNEGYLQLAKDQSCLLKIPKENIVEQSVYWRVVKPTNQTGYVQFDGMQVENHLMIVPNENLWIFNDLNFEETSDLIRLMKKYEFRGYSIFMKNLSMRSIKTLHIHLIKLK